MISFRQYVCNYLGMTEFIATTTGDRAPYTSS